jgi:hypothetical protein
LVAANNRPVQGGTREVSLELVFQGFSEDTGKPVKVVVPTKLCEADIEDDVIVSYTWLGEREFQVDPRRHGIRGWVESERVWIPGSAPAMVKTTTTVQETPPVQLRREDPEPNKMALDLFSGTGSATKVLQAHGYTVKSVDCDPKWEPTHPVNILEWDYAAEYPPGAFDLIVASPPCTEYSQALTTRPRNLEGADRLVLKALEIIEFYRPTKWWLETPAHGVLARSDLMAKYPYVDCDQCQFADYGYRKPTRFFGSNHLTELSHVRCDQRTCKGLVEDPENPTRYRCHKNRLGGHNGFVKKDLAYRLPPLLVEYVSGLSRPVSDGDSTVKKIAAPMGKKWRRNDYAVQKAVFDQIVRTLGVAPTVDAFSQKASARCERWWGPGSPEAEDAFTQPWGGGGIMGEPPIPLSRASGGKNRPGRRPCHFGLAKLAQ